MDFELSEQQGAVRDLARKFAQRDIAPRARRIDDKAEFDWDLHRRAAELGLVGMTAPEAYGGSGADTVTWCVAIEEVAKASSAVANGLTLTESMVHYIATLGTEAQKQRYLPGLAQGASLCAFGLTEPGAGSDAAAVSTTARRIADSFVLSGSKMF